MKSLDNKKLKIINNASFNLFPCESLQNNLENHYQSNRDDLDSFSDSFDLAENSRFLRIKYKDCKIQHWKDDFLNKDQKTKILTKQNIVQIIVLSKRLKLQSTPVKTCL